VTSEENIEMAKILTEMDETASVREEREVDLARAREQIIDIVILLSHVFAVVALVPYMGPLEKEMSVLPKMLGDLAGTLGLERESMHEQIVGREEVLGNEGLARSVLEKIAEGMRKREK
jgi:hypothetical protein